MFARGERQAGRGAAQGGHRGDPEGAAGARADARQHQQVLSTVTKAASTGAAQNAAAGRSTSRPCSARRVAGMDAALLQAVEANRKALQQMRRPGREPARDAGQEGAGRHREDGRHVLRRARARRPRARRRRCKARGPSVLRGDARCKGTDTGAQASATVEQLMRQRAEQPARRARARHARVAGDARQLFGAGQRRADRHVRSAAAGRRRGSRAGRHAQEVAGTSRMDALLLARMQFAANIGFHILFPTITIGAGLVAAVLPRCATQARPQRRQALARRLPALGQGVRADLRAGRGVSGVTMSFQFGTNWPGYMEQGRQHRRAAARLRGADRVLPRGRRSSASCCSAMAGARAGAPDWRPSSWPSAPRCRAFWILALNSWMQTPAGHEIVDGVDARRRAGWAVDLQPVVSVPPHAHAARLRADRAFLLAGLSRVAAAARRRRERSAREGAARRRCTLAAVLIPLQIFVGDLHGLNTLRAPAGQDRRDGRRVAHRARRAAAAVRHSRRARRAATDFAIAVPEGRRA